MRWIILVLVMLALPAQAVQPDEILADPALEARARSISQLLRCPVCQSENIDESNASVARDLRRVVRERLVAGDSDTEVVDYVVTRFGEFVLFEPRPKGVNLLLWLAGPAMLLAALLAMALYLRSRRTGPDKPLDPLSADEARQLEEILRRP